MGEKMNMGHSIMVNAASSNLVDPGSNPGAPAIYVDDESGAQVGEDWWPGMDHDGEVLVRFVRDTDTGDLVSKQGHRLACGGVPYRWRVKPEDYPTGDNEDVDPAADLTERPLR